MAVYAYDNYGNFLYGAKDNTSPYYQSNITAESVDYNTVHIKWNQIVPDPTDQNPTYWALVKTLTGLPDSPYEGKIVTGGAITQVATSPGVSVDTTNSVSFATEWYESFTTNTNVEVNYSLWVFNPSITAGQNTSGWINCGGSSTVIINATTTLDTISNWIPRAWQNPINGEGETLGEYEYEDLIATLEAYSLAYDSLRIKTNLLELSNDPRYLTTSLAKARQLDFGFDYEVALGEPYYRSLTYSGDTVNSLKGTLKGLSQYIVALTHMENKIEIGHNIFLDYNDSSFEESLGQWKVNKLTAAGTTGTTATQITYASTTGTAYPHLAPGGTEILTDTSSDAGSTPRTVGAMKVVIATGGAGALLCPTSTTFSLDVVTTTTLPITTLIPVTSGVSYVFNGWMVGDPTTYSTVTPYIAWYDYTGKHISNTQAVAATINTQAAAHAPNVVAVTKTVTASWQEFNAGSDMAASTGLTMGFKAPVNAKFALPMIKVTGVGTTYFDMLQFAEHHYSIEYQDARQLNVYLRGQEENILTNPTFEVFHPMFSSTTSVGISATTSGWFAHNATLDSVRGTNNLSTGGVDLTGNDGYFALAITAKTDSALDVNLAPEQTYTGPIVYSDWMPVDPNISYTFTLYPNQYQIFPYTDYRGRIGIEFSSMPSEDKQNAIMSYPDSNAYYYGSTNYLKTAQITSATYDDTTAYIWLTFNGTPTPAIHTGNYVSIKGMLNYPELNITDMVLNHDVHGNYYIALPTNLLSTPDGAVDTSNAIMCLMYLDNVSGVYEDLVSFANITEISVDLSGNNTDGPNTDPVYVAAIAPPYSKDTGMPYARVYLMPKLLTNETVVVDGLRFSPTLLVDQYYQQSSSANLLGPGPTPLGGATTNSTAGDLISSNKTKASDYFSGSGNSTAALSNNTIDPLTTQYYDPKFCVWERKIWYNFVGNPSFMMSSTGWTDIGYNTTSYTATPGVATLNIPAASTGGISTMFALPHPALGGEDIVVTFTIANMMPGETYSITSPDLYTPEYSNTPYKYNADFSTANAYISSDIQTLSAVFQAVSGSMMGTIELDVIPNGVNDVSAIVILASADYGSTASAPFMSGDLGAFTFPNPMDPTMSLYASYRDSVSAGISSYIPDWPVKVNRLFATIKNYIPNGSTFRLTRGWPSRGITDLTESLVYSPSFEKDLGLWTGEQASLARITYPGRYLDLVTHGIAYARVTANTLEPYENFFGITSEAIPIDYTKSYYGSIAVRPVAGTNAQGFYSFKVDVYKTNTAVIRDGANNIINNGTDILLGTINNKVEFSSIPTLPSGITFTTNSVAPYLPVAGDRWVDPYSLNETAEYTWLVNETGGLGQWVENDESIYYNPGNEVAFTGYATFSTTPPVSPTIGDRWFDTGSGSRYGEYIGYVWYDDQQPLDINATTEAVETPAWTAQWVELSVMYTQNDVYLDELHSPTWAYINVLVNKGDLQEIGYTLAGQSEPTVVNADYVKLRVECVPDQMYPNQAFDVDRVIFRE